MTMYWIYWCAIMHVILFMYLTCRLPLKIIWWISNIDFCSSRQISTIQCMVIFNHNKYINILRYVVLGLLKHRSYYLAHMILQGHSTFKDNLKLIQELYIFFSSLVHKFKWHRSGAFFLNHSDSKMMVIRNTIDERSNDNNEIHLFMKPLPEVRYQRQLRSSFFLGHHPSLEG